MEGGGLRGMKDAVSVDKGGEIGEESMVIWTCGKRRMRKRLWRPLGWAG